MRSESSVSAVRLRPRRQPRNPAKTTIPRVHRAARGGAGPEFQVLRGSERKAKRTLGSVRAVPCLWAQNYISQRASGLGVPFPWPGRPESPPAGALVNKVGSRGGVWGESLTLRWAGSAPHSGTVAGGRRDGRRIPCPFEPGLGDSGGGPGVEPALWRVGFWPGPSSGAAPRPG